jgi:lipopolysaccharide/colanic/teichoic acid biosynthesis glycosyltransferase
MNPTKSSENLAESTSLLNDPQIIRMNFSEAISWYQPDTYKELMRAFKFRTIKLSPVLPLDKPLGRMGKRLVDIIVSLLVLVLVFSWLLPIIALFIKMDSKGPVFFLQKRSGRAGRLFTCIKFRSMIVNSDADLMPAIKNDKRITRLGKFLRNSYFDELPQFFNVLMGDMSIIGPRPHMISDDIRYKDEIDLYPFRQKVKPGITGLSQVLGLTGPANELQKMKERVQLDIFYIRQWSVALDTKIIIRTIGKFFRP